MKRGEDLSVQAALFNVSPDPILVLSATNHVIHINHRTCDFFRKSEGEICGHEVYALFARSERSRLQNFARALEQAQRPSIFSKRWTTCLYEFNIYVLESELNYVITVRDKSTREAIDSACLNGRKLRR